MRRSWTTAVLAPGLAGLLALLLLLLAAVPGAGAVPANRLARGRSLLGLSPVTPAQATTLGRQAYVYGYPLLEFERERQTATSVACPDADGDAPVNALSNSAGFATPSERAVVAPNVDTLYSQAQLDLSNGPVVLSHPGMGRRYFVFQLLDPYTDTIAYIGSRTTGQAAGRFAITWAGHPGPVVPGARVIVSPYPDVWLIGRTLAGDPADQARARALMSQYALTPPGGAPSFPAGCQAGPPRYVALPGGLAFLDALSTALAQNPPPASDAGILSLLSAVGVGPGLTPQTAHLRLATLLALIGGVRQEASALPAQARTGAVQGATQDHGWSIPTSEIGAYGTNYLARAEIAALGLGANTPAEALYPTAFTDAAGRPLNGSTRYQIVLRHPPPVRGFWSLTLYNSAGFLVANPINRYAIGSSHPPLVRRRNGSIVIIVSSAPPTEKNVNWLPAPDGPFRLDLRLYWPQGSVLSGRWQPPPVTPIGS